MIILRSTQMTCRTMQDHAGDSGAGGHEGLDSFALVSFVSFVSILIGHRLSVIHLVAGSNAAATIWSR
jgi:hypothetical protein